jgi:hypothetical protein
MIWYNSKKFTKNLSYYDIREYILSWHHLHIE